MTLTPLANLQKTENRKQKTLFFPLDKRAIFYEKNSRAGITQR